MRPDQLQNLAQAIYAARFEGEPPRCTTPWDDLPPDAQAVWLRCARAAGEFESKRCSRIARIHSHHALWDGLIAYGWDEASERFGRGLAQRIEEAILEKGSSA
jgi:hypothetical protein